MDKNIFIKNGKFFIIYRDKFEPLEKFNERAWFIVNKFPTTQDEYDEITRLSRIWSNIKFNNCTYSEEVMNLFIGYL